MPRPNYSTYHRQLCCDAYLPQHLYYHNTTTPCHHSAVPQCHCYHNPVLGITTMSISTTDNICTITTPLHCATTALCHCYHNPVLRITTTAPSQQHCPTAILYYTKYLWAARVVLLLVQCFPGHLVACPVTHSHTHNLSCSFRNHLDTLPLFAGSSLSLSLTVWLGFVHLFVS